MPVSGDTTAMALKRFERDVLDCKPDVVVILFGTNDSRLAEPKVCVPLDRYEADLVYMITRCQSAGAKAVVCTPPPIDPGPYFKRHPKEPYDKAGGLEKILTDYPCGPAQRSLKAQRLWISAACWPRSSGWRLMASIPPKKATKSSQD